MKVDVNIIDGKVWIGGQAISASLSVANGQIVAISEKKFLNPAKRTISAEGHLVLPGIIDSHIHSRDPGATEREDFYTVTRAAAFGGVTTVFDMPNTIPPTSTVSAFRDKKSIAKQKAVVDFAFYAGAGSDNLKQIKDLAKEGAIGFKTFLTLLSPERTREAWGVYVSNDGAFIEVLQTIKETGLVSAVHAENSDIIQYYTNKLQAEKRKDFLAFGQSRPPVSEIAAISRALIFARHTGTRLHICHVGSKESVDLISQAKTQGQRVTSEVTPLYLLLSEEDLEKLGPYGLIFPPLRSKENRGGLYQAFAEGKIEVMNSDHAPYTREEIEKGWNDIWKAPPDGSPIEVMFPLMLNEVNKGFLSLNRVLSAMVEFPACLFGIAPRKGFIQVGADADLLIVDMDKERTIRKNNLHTKQKNTQFDGWKVKGLPILTMVRGKVVVENGELTTEPGWGQFVQPTSRRKS